MLEFFAQKKAVWGESRKEKRARKTLREDIQYLVQLFAKEESVDKLLESIEKYEKEEVKKEEAKHVDQRSFGMKILGKYIYDV